VFDGVYSLQIGLMMVDRLVKIAKEEGSRAKL
jgi:hypothetical protein